MIRQLRERSSGQGLVEFALVVPVIFFLLFGFIDVGRAVFEYNTLTNAARQGARVAAVNQLDPAGPPTECNPNRPVQDPSDPHWTFRGCAIVAGQVLGIGRSNVTISYSAPPGTSLECSTTVNVGCIASVTVTHTFSPITPVAGIVIGTINMTATSQMPVERIFP